MATGQSIMFDAHRMQEEQEEQLQMEENERQIQLKEMLANEFDDIEAEDTCSIASDESHDSGRHSGDIGNPSQVWPGQPQSQWRYASTPVSDSKAPPLTTPLITRRFSSQSPYHATNQYANHPTQINESDEYTVTKHNGAEGQSHYVHSEPQPEIQPHPEIYQTTPLQYKPQQDRPVTSQNNNNSNAPTTDQYFQHGGNERAQLDILYQAKSRQLQQLQEKYELLQLDSCKEMRILRHEISLLQGAKQGAEASLKQVQSMLTDSKESRLSLQKTIDSLEEKYNQMNTENQQMREELRLNEDTIESLNSQILALTSSETLQRTREQHEAILTSLKQNHESELDTMRELNSQVNQQLHDAKEQLDLVKSELKNERTSAAQERVEHADEINRLTKSLKESSEMAQGLLFSTSSEEYNRLKVQLDQANASKLLTEQLSQTLQNEMYDLREQISLYEMPTAVNTKPDSQFDDTIAELGIKPKINSEYHGGGDSSMLKTQLSKCMTSLKEKREELSKIRVELGDLTRGLMSKNTECSVLQERLVKLEKHNQELAIELNLYKSAASDGSTLTEVKLKADLQRAHRDIESLQLDLQGCNERLVTSLEMENSLERINSELNSKLSEMVDDFDRDKQAALVRCEEEFSRHNRAVKDMYEHDSSEKYKTAVNKLETQYKTQLEQLESANKTLSEELVSVKNLYVEICEEKENLHHKVTQLHVKTMPAEKPSPEQEAPLLQKISDLEGQKSLLETEKTSLQEKLISLQDQFKPQSKPNEQVNESTEHQNAGSTDQSDGSACVSNQSDGSVCRQLFNDKSALSGENSDSPLAIPLDERLEKVTTELNHTRQQVVSLNELITSLNSKLGINEGALTEMKGKHRQELINHHEVRTNMLTTQKQLRDSENNVTSLQAQLHQLQMKTDEDSTLISQLKEQLSVEQSEVQEKTTLIKSLQDDVRKLDSLLTSERVCLTTARSDLERIRRELETEKKVSNNENNQTTLQSLNEEKIKLERQIVKYESDLSAEKTSHALIKAELDKTEQQLNAERSKQCDNKTDMHNLQKLLTEEKGQLREIKSQVIQIKSALSSEQKNHNTARLRIVEIEAELSSERANHLQSKAVINRLKDSNSRLNEEFGVMKSQQNSENEKIRNLSSLIETQRNELKSKTENGTKVRNSLFECQTELVKIQTQLTQTQSAKKLLMDQLSLIKTEHDREISELKTEQEARLEEIVNEWKTRWNKHENDTVSEMNSENKYLKDRLNNVEREAARYEELLSQADKHFEQQLEKQRLQMEKEHQLVLNNLQNKYENIHKNTEQSDQIKHMISELEERCREYQDCTTELKERLEKSTKSISEFKSTNKKLHTQLKSMKSHSEQRTEKLQQQLAQCEKDSENSSLQYTAQIEDLKSQLQNLVSQPNNTQSAASASSETLTGRPEILKQQYEAALQQMRADVLKYVEDTNKTAARVIRAEAQKAKQSTARQLRNYYLKCFKDVLHDTSMSMSEKHSIMERTLDSVVAALSADAASLPSRSRTANDITETDETQSKTHDRTRPDLPIRSESAEPRSRYKYIPLRTLQIENQQPANPTPTNTASLFENLGLNKLEKTPPRQYNPPPEKLSPSPHKLITRPINKLPDYELSLTAHREGGAFRHYTPPTNR